MNYLENLRVLREAIANEPAPKLYLNSWVCQPDGADTPACGTLHCIGGLATTMPYFQQLGIRADSFTGGPRLGQLDPGDTLEHFFGRYETPGEPYESIGAMCCIFSSYSDGEWDRELAEAAGAIASDDISDFIDGDKMSHKQLALARLDHAIAYWEARRG